MRQPINKPLRRMLLLLLMVSSAAAKTPQLFLLTAKKTALLFLFGLGWHVGLESAVAFSSCCWRVCVLCRAHGGVWVGIKARDKVGAGGPAVPRGFHLVAQALVTSTSVFKCANSVKGSLITRPAGVGAVRLSNRVAENVPRLHIGGDG